jgi:hypothetical protein
MAPPSPERGIDVPITTASLTPLQDTYFASLVKYFYLTDALVEISARHLAVPSISAFCTQTA